MLLVNQFEVTLKDFVPKVSDGKVITDRIRGTTTTVSDRLYTRMRAYAIDNELPLDAVVRQLRDEIHSDARAENDPTMTTTRKFGKGDRVKLSLKGIHAIRSPRSRVTTDRRGTVAHKPQEKKRWRSCHMGRHENRPTHLQRFVGTVR